MAKPEMPKSNAELRALSDENLETLRQALTVKAETLRLTRKVLAREAERRVAHPSGGHVIAGAGGIESQEG